MTNRSIVRSLMAVLAAVATITAFAGIVPAVAGIPLAALGFFAAATDFGRQCPLLLSLRHLLARMRKTPRNADQ